MINLLYSRFSNEPAIVLELLTETCYPTLETILQHHLAGRQANLWKTNFWSYLNDSSTLNTIIEYKNSKKDKQNL